jgi:hypothetical protein
MKTLKNSRSSRVSVRNHVGNGLTAGAMVESAPLRVSQVLVGCVDLISEEDKCHDARGQSEGRESGGKRLVYYEILDEG